MSDKQQFNQEQQRSSRFTQASFYNAKLESDKSKRSTNMNWEIRGALLGKFSDGTTKVIK